MLAFLSDKVSAFFVRRSAKWQAESPLRDLDLWDLTTNDRGHITVDGLDTVDIVEQYGSPVLVVNQKRLVADAKAIKEALHPAPVGSQALFSYKTNGIPGILKEIHRLGIGAEVISPYELWLAERLGVPGYQLVFNGVNKTEESLLRAINMNLLAINIDHREEIARLYDLAKSRNRKVRVGVRLGLIPESQFGVEIESGEAMEVCRELAEHPDCFELSCIHFNVASNARNALQHKQCTLKALKFMVQLRQELGMEVPFLDIGGGFGIPTTKIMSRLEYGIYRLFGSLPKPPSLGNYQPIHAFLSEIVTVIEEFASKYNLAMPKLLIEPGRYITSRSEFLLTRVHAIKNKKNGIPFVITDAGRISLTYPCDYEYHEVFVANRPYDRITHPYHIMGRICTPGDWMFKNRYLPPLQPGDVLAVMDAGAYFSSYSSNFSFPRPAIVMVSDGRAHVIRKPETFEHLTAMDNINI